MLSAATPVPSGAMMIRVTAVPSSRHRWCGGSSAPGGDASSGARAWTGGRGGGGAARGGRASGLVVMARGKKEEPASDKSNKKDAKKGKEDKHDTVNRGKDQKKDGKEREKNGTAVGTSALPTPGGVPLPALGGGLLLGLVILGKIMGGKGSRGSVSALEERGTLDENRNVDEEKFYKGMMKKVRTVEMPELSDAQIQAARERRRQSHFADDGNAKESLENVNVPANHPWATTEKLSAAEKKAQEERVRELNKPRTRQRCGQSFRLKH